MKVLLVGLSFKCMHWRANGRLSLVVVSTRKTDIAEKMEGRDQSELFTPEGYSGAQMAGRDWSALKKQKWMMRDLSP